MMSDRDDGDQVVEFQIVDRVRKLLGDLKRAVPSRDNAPDSGAC